MSDRFIILHIEYRRVNKQDYTEKFDMITLGEESIKAILEATEDEALIRRARELGAKVPREFLMFWFKKRISNHTLDI